MAIEKSAAEKDLADVMEVTWFLNDGGLNSQFLPVMNLNV